VPNITLLAATALALSISGIVQAGIIGNGPANHSGGSDLNFFTEADDFVVGNPYAHITQIKFWAVQSGPADFTGTVDWAFYSNSGGFPGSSVIAGNASATGASTGFTVFGLDEFAYTFNIDATLAPGTYWLVLHNGPSNVTPDGSFYWAWSNGNSGNSASLDPSPASPWAGNFTELAFEMTDSVPEPMSTSLVGGGLLAAWLLRRKKELGA
jgi:hypothetical protein